MTVDDARELARLRTEVVALRAQVAALQEVADTWQRIAQAPQPNWYSQLQPVPGAAPVPWQQVIYPNTAGCNPNPIAMPTINHVACAGGWAGQTYTVVIPAP